TQVFIDPFIIGSGTALTHVTYGAWQNSSGDAGVLTSTAIGNALGDVGANLITLGGLTWAASTRPGGRSWAAEGFTRAVEDRTAAEEPPWAAEAYPSDHVGIGATAHLPSPSGTDSMSASDQEPEIVARTSPSPAAAIHGVENAP